MRTHQHWVILALIVALSSLGSGCEEPAQSELMAGRQALQEGNPDRAEGHLEAAAEADPELVEAQRLMANVHMQRGDFELAESNLIALWNQLGFGEEEDLNSAQMSTRQVFQKQFGALYRQWAQSIDYSQSPDEFEEVVRTGLARNARDSQLHRLLIDFYQHRADRFIEQREKIRAAEMLEKIDDLQAFSDTRREARQRARNLRREAFQEEARQRFEESLAADLREAGVYDEATQTLRLEARIEPPPGEGPDGDREQVRHTAVQTLLPQLGQLAAAVTDQEADAIDLSALEVPRLTVRDEDWQTSEYLMVISFGLSDLIDMAFKYSEAERTRDDRPAAEGSTPGTTVTLEREAIELDTRAVDGD